MLTQVFVELTWDSSQNEQAVKCCVCAELVILMRSCKGGRVGWRQRVNVEKTKVMKCGIGHKKVVDSGEFSGSEWQGS